MANRTLIEQKRYDLEQMRRDMKGISPKTSTYQKLKEGTRKLFVEIAELEGRRIVGYMCIVLGCENPRRSKGVDKFYAVCLTHQKARKRMRNAVKV
jgi:hypothetical protein